MSKFIKIKRKTQGLWEKICIEDHNGILSYNIELSKYDVGSVVKVLNTNKEILIKIEDNIKYSKKKYFIYGKNEEEIGEVSKNGFGKKYEIKLNDQILLLKKEKKKLNLFKDETLLASIDKKVENSEYVYTLEIIDIEMEILIIAIGLLLY